MALHSKNGAPEGAPEGNPSENGCAGKEPCREQQESGRPEGGQGKSTEKMDIILRARLGTYTGTQQPTRNKRTHLAPYPKSEAPPKNSHPLPT